MRLVSQEYCVDYTTYSFGYRNWAVREDGEKLYAIYDSGHLPYSADLTENNYFYMARSIRVRLADFVPSSENRRVLRKFEGEVIAKSYPLSDFSQPGFEEFCLAYFVREHGPNIMSTERFRHIMSMGVITDVVHYTDKNGETLGYVLLASEPEFSHYWFSFYAERVARQSFGMYMMLDCALRSKEAGEAHFYLGTAYGASGRYKLNFPNAEYWSGIGWSDNIAQLKELLAAEIAAKEAAKAA